MIKGDFACVNSLKKISPSLIDSPDFLSPFENSLRLETLKHSKGRKWLYNLLVNKSFAFVEIEKEDFANNLYSAYGIPIKKLAGEYKKAYERKSGFDITFKKDNKKKSLSKSKKDIDYVLEMKKVFEQKKFLGSPLEILTNPQKTFDFYRVIWIKTQDGYEIIDGNHRSIAITWSMLNKRSKIFPLYAFVLHED